MIWLAVTKEFSTSLLASSSIHVTMKPSPTASKSARRWSDFKITWVRLADYLILARMTSRDRVGRSSKSCAAQAAEAETTRSKKATTFPPLPSGFGV
jgi:hypothetical protein